MDPPWVTKGRGKGNNPRGRGRSSSGSSYGSFSNFPVLQQGKMSLISSKLSQNTASSSVHLEDISEDSPLYTELRAYMSQKQGDTFVSIAKDDIDDIKSNEKDYSTLPHKRGPIDNFVKHIARRISIQDGNKEEMINEYLDEVRRNLLLNVTHYEKSDTSMKSETSHEAPNETPQPCGDTLQQIEDFLLGLKGKDAAA
uniref:Uncharacterized protein n=1 Tax=Solanum tuberosum TaxID=4113 RepID=M1DNA2_SOLTU